MTLTRYGNGIIDIKGKLGGQVHSRDNSGNHTSALYYRKKSPSASQLRRRKWFSRLAELYRTGFVSEDNKAKWNTYSRNHPIVNKFGEAKFRTAYNTFLWYNLIRVTNDLEPMPSPPSD